MSKRRRVPTNWVSDRTLQPSIESVVANSFVPSDFLVDGQVSGLGTVHPFLTLSFVSTWILSLHVVSSTLKRKSSSSVMDGLQRRLFTDKHGKIGCADKRKEYGYTCRHRQCRYTDKLRQFGCTDRHRQYECSDKHWQCRCTDKHRQYR